MEAVGRDHPYSTHANEKQAPTAIPCVDHGKQNASSGGRTLRTLWPVIALHYHGGTYYVTAIFLPIGFSFNISSSTYVTEVRSK